MFLTTIFKIFNLILGARKKILASPVKSFLILDFSVKYNSF